MTKDSRNLVRPKVSSLSSSAGFVFKKVEELKFRLVYTHTNVGVGNPQKGYTWSLKSSCYVNVGDTDDVENERHLTSVLNTFSLVLYKAKIIMKMALAFLLSSFFL